MIKVNDETSLGSKIKGQTMDSSLPSCSRVNLPAMSIGSRSPCDNIFQVWNRVNLKHQPNDEVHSDGNK